MSGRIQEITLKGFRGATSPVNIDFDLKKPIVMVFGENGTGKSTIVDGIDFVCNERYGSLNDRSIQGTKSKLISSLNSNENDLEVSLKCRNETWNGKIGYGNKPKSKGLGIPPQAHILRRSQILSIIDSQPGKRYEELKAYIQVTICEKNEESLKKAIINVTKDYEKSTNLLRQSKDTLRKLSESEDKPVENVSKWGQLKLRQDRDTLIENSNRIERLLKSISLCENQYESLIKYKKQLKESESKRNKEKEAFLKNQQKVVEASSQLIDVLEKAKSYLLKNSTAKNCPVCEREIDVKKLQARIDERLKGMDEQISLKDSYEKAEENLKTMEKLRQSNIDKFVELIKTLMETFYDNKIFEFIREIKEEPEPFWEKYHLDDLDKISRETAKEIYKAIMTYHEKLKVKKGNMEKNSYELNTIKIHLKIIKKNEAESKVLEKKVKKLEALHETIEAERKAFVESVLADISESVEQLYEKIHPGEGYGRIRFYLNQKTKGSLLCTGQYQDFDGIVPQAYYSESHLDTLGICVFMALAKYYNEGDTILVMDDVITSVDQVHLDRFMNMLHEEAKHFNQVIITTHYRPWRDMYRYARGPSANVQLIELLPWSLNRGIRHSKTKLIVDDLEKKYNNEPLDRQAVSSEAGILLESLLDYLTLQYHCRLPRQAEPVYTFGNLLDGISKKLSEALVVETYKDENLKDKISLTDFLSRISLMNWIRNQVGCHFNLLGMDISDSHVRKMVDTTIEFARTLICDECGQLATSDKSGSYWECICRKKRLYPLSKPK